MLAVFILDPDNQVFNDLTALIGPDTDEAAVRLQLYDRFARSVLGSKFPRITPNAAWNIWKVAEENGFQVKVAPALSSL